MPFFDGSPTPQEELNAQLHPDLTAAPQIPTVAGAAAVPQQSRTAGQFLSDFGHAAVRGAEKFISPTPKSVPKEEKKGFKEGEDAQAQHDTEASQPSGPTFVPPGWHPEMYPEPDWLVKQRMGNIQREGAIEQRAAEAEWNAIGSQAAQMDVTTRAAEEANKLRVAREDEQRARLDEAQKKFSSFVDEAASGKVDPNRYLANQSTGSRILMALSAGLVGMADARDGKPNSALEMMQRNIDRDIRAQEHDISAKQWRAGEARNMLGELRAAGNDSRQAAIQLEAAQWRIAEQQLKTLALQNQSPIAKAKADMIGAQIQSKLTGLSQEYYRSIFSRGGMVGGAPSGSEDAALETPEGRALTPADAAELRKESANEADYQQKLSDLKASRSWGNLLSPFNNEGSAAWERAFAADRARQGRTRAPTEEERKAFTRKVGSPNSWALSTSSRIDQEEEASRQERETKVKSHLVDESRRNYAYDKNHRVVRTSELTGRPSTGKSPRHEMPKTYENKPKPAAEEE